MAFTNDTLQTRTREEAPAIEVEQDQFQLGTIDTGVGLAAEGRGQAKLEELLDHANRLSPWDDEDDLLARAKEILSERMEILRLSQPAMSKAAAEIGAEYNIQTRQQGYEGLSYESVNRIFRDTIERLPENAQKIWGDLQNDPDIESNPMFKVFTWAFNRMKQIQGEQELIQMRNRGTLDGDKMPYASHSHIDVPYCMHALGFQETKLSVALAASHDTYEEGNGIRVEATGINLRELDLKQLLQRFPDENLGRMLAVGIQTLTESEYTDLALTLPVDDLDGYQQIARLVHEDETARFEGQDRWITKMHQQDPLVFGGLAVQVAMTIDKLGQRAAMGGSDPMSAQEMYELAAGIAKVELGDRLSDISTIDRQLDMFPNDPEFARYKIMAYAARMLNMHEKIQSAVDRALPAEMQAEFAPAFDRYVGVLANKLIEINDRLEQAGVAPISAEAFSDMQSTVFRPIQDAADAVTREFLEAKVDRYMQLVG